MDAVKTGRPKGEEKIKVGTKIPIPLNDRIKTYSEKTGISITRIFEDALTAYLAKHEK